MNPFHRLLVSLVGKNIHITTQLACSSSLDFYKGKIVSVEEEIALISEDKFCKFIRICDIVDVGIAEKHYVHQIDDSSSIMSKWLRMLFGKVVKISIDFKYGSCTYLGYLLGINGDLCAVRRKDRAEIDFFRLEQISELVCEPNFILKSELLVKEINE